MAEVNQQLPQQNIVLCSDGTGNRGGVGYGTNVWQIFKAVDKQDHKADPTLPEQRVFYDDGVGTEDFKLLKILGGALGYGLGRNIRQLYSHLVRSYQPGDNIYLFGFSRGAYTVRLLAGMICQCGVLDYQASGAVEELDERIKRLYKLYIKGDEYNELPGLRDKWCHAQQGDYDIKFVGVWDTVDALGVPFDKVRNAINHFFHYQFSDQKLNPRVEKGCHALAIDDARLTFHPVMWDEASHDNIEQVWFSGVHSNVGGGYPKNGMSLITLDWMMGKATEQGLRFQAGWRENIRGNANVHTKLYDSRAGLAAYYRYLPRDIGELCQDSHIDTPKVHLSVLERIDHATMDYAPLNLPHDIKVVGSDDRQPLPGESPQRLTQLTEHVNSHADQRMRTQVEAEPYIQKRYSLYWVFFATSAALLWAMGPSIFMSVLMGDWQDAVAWAGDNAKLAIGAAVFMIGLFLYRKHLVSQVRVIGLKAWGTVMPLPKLKLGGISVDSSGVTVVTEEGAEAPEKKAEQQTEPA